MGQNEYLTRSESWSVISQVLFLLEFCHRLLKWHQCPNYYITYIHLMSEKWVCYISWICILISGKDDLINNGSKNFFSFPFLLFLHRGPALPLQTPESVLPWTNAFPRPLLTLVSPFALAMTTTTEASSAPPWPSPGQGVSAKEFFCLVSHKELPQLILKYDNLLLHPQKDLLKYNHHLLIVSWSRNLSIFCLSFYICRMRKLNLITCKELNFCITFSPTHRHSTI